MSDLVLIRWIDSIRRTLASPHVRYRILEGKVSQTFGCSCGSDDLLFDRSLCACGSMHYFCGGCGGQVDECHTSESAEGGVANQAKGDPHWLEAHAELVDLHREKGQRA